jgi:hypothetical protein
MMRASDFTLLFLVSFAVLSLLGGWLWTRHDLRKQAEERPKENPPG